MRYQSNRINPSRFDRSQIKFLLILLPLAVLYALPIIYITVTAFKPLGELFAYPPRFYVNNPTLNNFHELSNVMSSANIPVGRYLLNSLFSTCLVIAFSLIIGIYAAYTLAKKRFRCKELLNTINTMAMMFVPVAVTIPRYLIMEKLGIVNSFGALVMPLIAMPVGMYLLKQFIQDIPDALMEAARLDGASENQIVWKVIVPIVRPALATVAILAFQSSWNAVEPSSLFISRESGRTFAFFMSTLASNQGNNVAGAGMVAAAALIMFLPNLIIFIIMQSSVMNTMSHSGIK